MPSLNSSGDSSPGIGGIDGTELYRRKKSVHNDTLRSSWGSGGSHASVSWDFSLE